MSLSLLRLKMIDLVRAGHIDRHEYSLFAELAKGNERPGIPPMEFVDIDVTAPVFSFFEQQGIYSGFKRIGAATIL